MGISSYHNEDYNFIFTEVSDKIDSFELELHVSRFNECTVDMNNFNELADCRKLQDVSGLSAQEVARTAMSENKKMDCKLAILVNDSPVVFGLARAYEMFAEHRRESVDIFYNLNEALDFLGYNEEESKYLSDYSNRSDHRETPFCSLKDLQLSN